MRHRHGCAFVSVKRAARELRVPVETIENLVERKAIPYRDDPPRVQIPATRRVIVRMTEDALRRLSGPEVVATSPDGVTWTTRDTPLDSQPDFAKGVVWNGSSYVAVG